ncbi:MAG: YD repeat-containing protein, partial [Myxococcota bacterium]
MNAAPFPVGTNARAEWIQSYDGYGRQTTVIDPNVVTTFQTYDDFGRRLEDRLTPAGGTIHTLRLRAYVDSLYGNSYVDTHTLEYSGPNQWVSDHTQREVLSGSGQVVQTWTPNPVGDGSYVVQEHLPDGTGNIARVGQPHKLPGLAADFLGTRNPSLHTCTSSDAFGRVRGSFTECAIVGSDYTGAETVLTDVSGPGLTESTDDVGYIKRTLSDTRGRLIAVHEGDVNGLDRTGSYRYDARDRITRFTDAHANEYAYTFDLAGRVEQVTRLENTGNAPEVWYSFAWDGPEPQAMWEGLPTGTPASEWKYDALGRTTEKYVRRPGSNSTDVYTWTWDTEWYGARGRVEDPWGSVEYSYGMGPFGAMDQPKSVTREWNDGFHTLEQRQVSDLMGRPIWAQHPDGSEVYTTVDYNTGMVEED